MNCEQRVNHEQVDVEDRGTLLVRPWTRFESTKQAELRFSALLSEGAREVRFERVGEGCTVWRNGRRSPFSVFSDDPYRVNYARDVAEDG